MKESQQSDTYSEAEPDNRKESIREIELRPDGEDRFRRAVRAAAKSGPMHRHGKDAKAK